MISYHWIESHFKKESTRTYTFPNPTDYGKGKFHIYKNFYVPEALPIVAFGVIAGWLYGTQGDIAKPVKGGAWAGDAFIKGFEDIGDYIGIVLPFSIAASFTDMMCLVSAQKAGDPYP